MRIFSSFDTKFKDKILQREKEKFWDDVLLITHWKFFYYFVVIFPAFVVFIWMLLYLIVYFYFWGKISDDFKIAYYIIWFLLFLFIFSPIVFKIIKKYIDYILDFVVVTPNSLIYYNQEWILFRKWRTIDTDKIKTITVSKNGLIRSMFNFWNIVVLSEWDEQWEWEINFIFVDDPDKLKTKIFKIIKK